MNRETGARLICVKCGATIQLKLRSVMDSNEETAVKAGFQLHSYRLDVSGICQECGCEEP